MRLRSLVQLTVLMIPALASAATITVRKDGTGDFALIQAALDAAAAGDTIAVGPGEFGVPTAISLPGVSNLVISYAVVRVADLTIIGSDDGNTSIGPTSFEGGGIPNTPQGITCEQMTGRLTLRHLTIENCEVGLWIKGALQMEDCRIRGTNMGMYWLPAGSGGRVSNTTVSSVWSSPGGSMVIGNGTPVSGVVVDNCVIPGDLGLRGVQGAEIRDCQLGSATLMLGTVASMIRCSTSATGNGVTQAVGTGASCSMDDCVLRGSFATLTVDPSAPGARFVVSNSRLEGGSKAILWARPGSGPCAIHGSDLVKGSGAAVVCDVSTAVVVHDLTNNWWGTVNAADIASWIIDSADDPNIGASVLYSPFAGQSVPTESTSWGDLKAKFR